MTTWHCSCEDDALSVWQLYLEEVQAEIKVELHLSDWKKNLTPYKSPQHKKQKKIYHLESRWRNSHVLVYHGPLLIHLLGVASHLLSPRCSHATRWRVRPTFSAAPRARPGVPPTPIAPGRRGTGSTPPPSMPITTRMMIYNFCSQISYKPSFKPLLLLGGGRVDPTYPILSCWLAK